MNDIETETEHTRIAPDVAATETTPPIETAQAAYMRKRIDAILNSSDPRSALASIIDTNDQAWRNASTIDRLAKANVEVGQERDAIRHSLTAILDREVARGDGLESELSALKHQLRSLEAVAFQSYSASRSALIALGVKFVENDL